MKKGKQVESRPINLAHNYDYIASKQKQKQKIIV